MLLQKKMIQGYRLQTLWLHKIWCFSHKQSILLTVVNYASLLKEINYFETLIDNTSKHKNS